VPDPTGAARICVVGSVTMDLVVRADRFPASGETLLGGPFATYPGGKGANQAVAAARQGARVEMVGCVGDLYGEELLAVLDRHGVGREGVEPRPEVASGVGVITVVPSGENRIVVAPGANARVDERQVVRHAASIAKAHVLLLQLETTDEANRAAIGLARESGTTVILNAAPAAPVSRESLEGVDVLVVNRPEAEAIAGRAGETPPEALLDDLLSLGAREAVITLGESGAILANGAGTTFREAFPVEAIDATGAGDAFVGAFAVSLAEGRPPEVALARASAAGALAVTVPGAMPSMPDRAAVDELL
jgi:ribokinase